MGPTLYEWMTAGQADEAMVCFLAERVPALPRVREGLAEHGRDADSLLDGTPGSVAGVWEWTAERCTELGTDRRTLAEDPTRERWPSWARHGVLVDPHPPAGALVLVHGFVSYLAEVVAAAVPDAHRRIGEHRLSDYPMLNRPVLAGEHPQILLPALPLSSVYQAAHDRTPMDGHEMLEHTERTICALREEGPHAATTEEPLVSVVAEVGCFDVGRARTSRTGTRRCWTGWSSSSPTATASRRSTGTDRPRSSSTSRPGTSSGCGCGGRCGSRSTSRSTSRSEGAGGTRGPSRCGARAAGAWVHRVRTRTRTRTRMRMTA